MKKWFSEFINTSWKVNAMWYGLPLIATYIQTLFADGTNNYTIYKNVFAHTVAQKDLYAYYPELYIDKNNYGIIFSLIIAPFSYLPDQLAIILYQLVQLLCLQFVIRKLPISILKQNILLLFLIAEAIANCQNVQTNTFIGFIMVGTYVMIINSKEMKAAMLIMLGFFVKVYGIVALGLFFFVKDKMKFIVGIVAASLLLYFLPLLITNLDFINATYLSWFNELSAKNGSNIELDNPNQNMSAIGIIMKVFHNNSFNVLWIIAPAFMFQILPLIRYRLWQNQIFQMKYLSTLLLFIILYSTSTEASTHIIGAIGIGIWWLTSDQFDSPKMLWFILFCFVLGTLSVTDIFPSYVNSEIIRKYALKALPYWIVWCICIYQLLVKPFKTKTLYEQ